MKVGVLTIALNEERFIGACVKQFLGVEVLGVELEHLVMIGNSTWTGQKVNDAKTESIARELGARVVKGNWESETEERQIGLNLLSDKDWILIVDADEYYTKEAIETMLKFLKLGPVGKVYRSAAIHVYWKDWETIALPSYGVHGSPVVAVKPDVRFSTRDILDEDSSGLFPGSVETYHLSYCRDDEEIYKKITSFAHAHEILPGWFENVWKKWQPGDTNFHPTAPHVFERAEHYPLPEEIKKLFENA